MKRMKKGFTIVELVIVIAVIGILAAVLIPTFSSVAKKARINADTQVVRNLNTSLSTYEISNGKPEDFAEVIGALKEDGYVIANLNPTTDGWFYVWESGSNQILLVDEKYDIQYKAKDLTATEPGATWYFAISDADDAAKVEADLPSVNVRKTVAKVSDLNNAINVAGESIVYIDESITIDASNTIELNKADAKVTIDLGKAVVSGKNDGSLAIENIPFRLNAGELTIKGGVINASGNTLDADGEVANHVVHTEGGVLKIEDCIIETVDGVIPIALENTTATIKNTKILSGNNIFGTYAGTDLLVENCEVDADYLVVFASNNGGVSTVTVNGGKYHASISNLLGVYGGQIVVKDGEFNCDSAEKTFKFYDVAGSKIVLEGGTFNGVAFEDLTETMLQGWVNKSDIGSSTISVAKVGNTWEITLVKA